MIKSSRDDVSPYQPSDNTTTLEVITRILCNDSKFTVDYNKAFNQGYIQLSPELVCRFSVRHNSCYIKI